ncbi:hypothetical protein EVAR_14244_1 [Eumeta japonica]|uniref:Uncharacterized protein n=1 Tax=Eumeta variegata TaxID=151549 RepID=A0A4C1W9K5_EUMVA|nr:hypothetical protein EVAR_14244_1 [Eumeta japonica]
MFRRSSKFMMVENELSAEKLYHRREVWAVWPAVAVAFTCAHPICTATKVLHVLLLLAGCWPLVPGGQQWTGNVTDFPFFADRSCRIGEFADAAICHQTNAHLDCKNGIAMQWLKGVQWVTLLILCSFF